MQVQRNFGLVTAVLWAGISVTTVGVPAAEAAAAATPASSVAPWPTRLSEAGKGESLKKAAPQSGEGVGLGATAGGVSNDSCSGATAISGLGTFGFDNTLAVQDGPVHPVCNFFETVQLDHDVWFCWTAPQTPCEGDIVVETCGQTVLDTKIAVYEGCSCPVSDADLLACRDDDCNSEQSRAAFSAVPGQTYLIRVGTFPGRPGGLGDFLISCQSATPCTEPVNHCQVADQTDALSSNRTRYRVADSMTPPQSGNIESVCWWGAYLTPPPESVDCQGLVPDSFEVRYFTDVDGVPGTLLGSFSQSGGTLAVDPPVTTGLFINLTVPEFEFHATHSPIAVTAGDCVWVEISNEMTGCNWFWEVALNGDGRAMQDGLLTGAPDGYTNQDAVADDLAFCVNLEIDSNGSACQPAAPVNDLCANALPLVGEGEFSVDNSWADSDGPAHPACEGSGQTGIGRDVWYRWTSSCDGQVLFRTCNQTEVDSKVAVYAGSDCPLSGTTPLACNDDICNLQTMVLFNASLGQDYLLRIGSFPGAPGGVIGFDISCGAPNNAACPGTGTCCDATGGPGCGDELCCETVCACDPVCCDVEWDAFCAGHGFDDSSCGAIDLCGCGSVCGRPEAGSCCEAHATPGCNDAACCEAVCACDSFCCEMEWDENCSTEGFEPGCGAGVLCQSLCAAGPNCPAGDMTFSSPTSGAVDARQPHLPGNSSARQGFQTFVATGPAGAESACWTPCETAAAGTPNSISNVVESPAGTYTITLVRPITAGAVTTLTYSPTTGAASTGFFTSHPANVNGDSQAAPVDILDLIDNLNGVRQPPLNLWQCDIDRSAQCQPADILSEIDLLNGATGFAVWNGTARPSATGICPPP